MLIANDQVLSQVLPKEGSVLNYRLIGFSLPPALATGSYELQIAVGNYTSVDSFKKNILLRLGCKNKKIIAEVPFFGKAYTWSMRNMEKKGAIGELHHFSTGSVNEVDTAMTRLRVIKKAVKNNDAYVLLD